VAFIEITVEVWVAKWLYTKFITDDFISDESKFYFLFRLASRLSILSFEIILAAYTEVRFYI